MKDHAGAAGIEKVHPLGKSPVIEDYGMVIAESGAILEYLQDTYDSIGRFKPADAQGNNTIDSGYITLKVRSCPCY